MQMVRLDAVALLSLVVEIILTHYVLLLILAYR
jgi:hypothetical protein